MSLILAVDQSTSATKALLVTRQGGLRDKTMLEHRQFYPQPGWVEHDAAQIYQNTLQTLETLLGRNPHAAGNLLCLSITNQRETIVVFDKTTGKPLYNALVWQCRRGDPICAALIEQGHSEAVQQKTRIKGFVDSLAAVELLPMLLWITRPLWMSHRWKVFTRAGQSAVRQVLAKDD
jgi:glycerol kinase